MPHPRRSTGAWILLLALAFAFRLAYGLSSPFWLEDERQVYLVGLRAFARGEWPFFGADVVWTGSRLPGALQGLLIRWPLEFWPAPEAPFVLLNVLSFSALSFLAWYLARRAPEVPRWLIWFALLTLPWTLNFSTHVVNTSYILPGAVIFFIGFLEGTPSLARGLLPRWLAWTCMGAGLGWLPQIHMSWVLLPAYAAFAGLDVLRRERASGPRATAGAVAAFIAGAAVTGSLLVPTVMNFGFAAGGIERTVQFQPQGPEMFLTIAARFFSFTAFETNRFLGLSTADRILFLLRQPWIAPMLLFVTAIGLVQPIVMAAAWFRSGGGDIEWRRARWLTAATLVWIYASFFFSVRGPLAHAFYVVFPVSAFYATAVWQTFVVRSPRSRLYTRLAAATLAGGVILHTGLAIDRIPRQSLYVDRALAQTAIDAPNDRFLGDRRVPAGEVPNPRPRPNDSVQDPDVYLAATPGVDLKILGAEWRPAFGGVSRFDLEVENHGVPAYGEIYFEVTYTAADGSIVAVRPTVVREIIQPGERRRWTDVADGTVPEGAESATLRVIHAEKIIPVRGSL